MSRSATRGPLMSNKGEMVWDAEIINDDDEDQNYELGAESDSGGPGEPGEPAGPGGP